MTIVNLQTATPVVWSDGSTFNGYLVVMLAPPVASNSINWPGDGILSYTSPEAWSQTGQMRLPDVYVLPIYGGAISTNAGVLANTDINPPGSKYFMYYYDIARKRIAGPASSSDYYVFTSSPGTITQPSLPVPTPPSGVPAPDA